ncbi:MAG: hypothetical protein VX453_01150 [Acidobacteriota bacterium]|nr:hypothetical protein [Acidobacteriota bacterium]
MCHLGPGDPDGNARMVGFGLVGYVVVQTPLKKLFAGDSLGNSRLELLKPSTWDETNQFD